MAATYSVGAQKGKKSFIRKMAGYSFHYMHRSEVAVHGKCVVREKADSFYGEGKDFQSKVLTDPTYGVLCSVASAQMRRTGDQHHRFFEGVGLVGKDVIDGEEVQVLTLFMGS